MGMESVYRLSVILNAVDNMTETLRRTEQNTNSSIERLNKTFGTMQKAGAVMTGVGVAITGAAVKTATATFETQNALGELASLGVKDLEAVEAVAQDFSNTWAGTTKPAFITAAYDIKSGIASLSDEGVAEFTKLAALTGKATKSTTEEMGSLFATGYGIYKDFYSDLSDMEFGEMFSSGISTAVRLYKTSGSGMASAISALGATATNSNVSLEEQLAILGQLQTTMSGSEAATKYRAFLTQAAKAGDGLGLAFLDANNQLKSTPDILRELKSKYGDTIDAIEKQELKAAFGTDEAVAMIDLLYNNVDVLEGGITDLQTSMAGGTAATEEMAEAINNMPEQKFEVLKQKIHNGVEEIGKGLLPAINNALDGVSKLIDTGLNWMSSNQETVQTLANIVLYLGIFLTISGIVIGIVGTVGKVFMMARNSIGMVSKAMKILNLAFLANPVTWVIIGIMALIGIFLYLWNTSKEFRSFWIDLFRKMQSTVSDAWKKIQPSLDRVGVKFKELYTALEPLINILGLVFGEVLTIALGLLVGFVSGAVEALSPLLDAFSSFIAFVTDIINMFVALFHGDFEGALEYAQSAFGNFSDFISNGFDGIISFAEGFAEGFLDVVGGALKAIGINADEEIEKLKTTISEGLDAVKETFSEKMGEVSDGFKNTLEVMRKAYEEHGGGILGLAAASTEGTKYAWHSLTEYIKKEFIGSLAVIDLVTGGRLSEIKRKYEEHGGGIKGILAVALSEARTGVATSLTLIDMITGGKLTQIRNKYQEYGGGIKGILAVAQSEAEMGVRKNLTLIDIFTGGKLTQIRNKYQEYGGGIKGIVLTAMDSLNQLTGGKLGILSVVVGGRLDAVKTLFSQKMEAIRAAVANVIQRIKEAFHFNWSLPNLKLPHVNISGGFSLTPPSVPKFSIAWHKNGGIMTKPTLFGAAGSTLLGGGEAGAEAILPLSLLWSQLRTVLAELLQTGTPDADVQTDGKELANSLFGKTTSYNNESTKTEKVSEKDSRTTIQHLEINVDISKVKDLDTLFKLIDEIKDMQNQSEDPPVVLA